MMNTKRGLIFILTASLILVGSAKGEELVGGFNLSEARAMATLICDLNGSGIAKDSPPNPDKNCPAVNGWTLAWDNGTEAEKLKNPQDCEKKEEGYCGIKPFNNRWKIWKKDRADKTYALVIRGTIGDAKSILSDALATTLPADNITIHNKAKKKKLQFTISPNNGAEVHMGFAYSLAAIMFPKDKGILRVLESLPAGSQLYIAGHSQGAAIATLAHAFLDHVQNEGEYGLTRKFSLKSYVFAQPKPGNWNFAMSFAQRIGNQGMSYTINNSGDWVPQVPLTIQFLSGTLDIVSKDTPKWARVTQAILGAPLREARSFIARESANLANKINDVSGGFDEKYFGPEGGNPPKAGSTLDYMPVGVVLAVGPCDGQKCKKAEDSQGDVMYEHHIYNYYQLINALEEQALKP